MSYHFLPTCPKHNAIPVKKDGTCPVCTGETVWDALGDAWKKAAPPDPEGKQ